MFNTSINIRQISQEVTQQRAKPGAELESSMRMNKPHTCSADWNDTLDDPNHF